MYREDVPRTFLGRPVRFLIVGAWNTLFGWLSFAGFYKLFAILGWSYVGAAFASHLTATLNAYLFQRFFVFKDANAAVAKSFLRFCAAYIALFCINLPALVVLVTIGLHPLVAQLVLIAGTAIVSYIVHV